MKTPWKIRVAALGFALAVTALFTLLADKALVAMKLPCANADVRICAIDAQLRRLGKGHRVSYQIHREPNSPVYAHTQWVIYGTDVVHLGPPEQWSDEALFFVMAHEYGHSLLRHPRKLLESAAPKYARVWPDGLLAQRMGVLESDSLPIAKDVSYEVELEADAFAIRAMQTFHVPVERAMREVLGQSQDGARHPGSATRYAQAKAMLVR